MQDCGITSRYAGMFSNVGSGLKLSSIAHEVFKNVPAISEVVHDVFELVCVQQTDGMPQFVDARQIHDRIA